MEKRREKYQAAADIVIETDGKDKLEICEELVQRIRALDAEEEDERSEQQPVNSTKLLFF